MKQTPTDSGPTSKFTFDPTNKVVGVVNNARDAEAVLLDLRSRGFPADQVEVLTNEEGARRIDASDEGHDVIVHAFVSTQTVPEFYDAPVIARRVEEELLAGHHFIGVVAKDGDARQRVREILKSHGGHFINFYGRWAAESLDP